MHNITIVLPVWFQIALLTALLLAVVVLLAGIALQRLVEWSDTK